MKQFLVPLLLVVLPCLPSCTIGSSRSFDHRQGLTGLDLDFLHSRTEATYDENTQDVDGELSGFPFWFLPVVSVHGRGTNALHRGDLEPREKPDSQVVSKISGYEYTDIEALGLGVLTYQSDTATWDDEGSLERWQQASGVGWGLVYSNKEWGDGSGRTGLTSELFAGLLGYTEDQGRGYLKLLWIHIPVR